MIKQQWKIPVTNYKQEDISKENEELQNLGKQWRRSGRE